MNEMKIKGVVGCLGEIQQLDLQLIGQHSRIRMYAYNE